MPKIKRTYFCQETHKPLGSVSAEYPEALAERMLAVVEEAAIKTNAGRPVYYKEGVAMSCAQMEAANG